MRKPHKVLHDKAIEPIKPDTLYKNTNGFSIRVYQSFAIAAFSGVYFLLYTHVLHMHMHMYSTLYNLTVILVKIMHQIIEVVEM